MPRPARLVAPTLACALVAAVPQASSAAQPSHPPQEVRTPAAFPASSPGGWTLSSHRIDAEDSYHAYVGNGYLGQRVAPHGSGYAATGEKTGWPLFTPRYDGSFVAGLYAHNKETAENRQALAALPTWTGLNVATGGEAGETFSSGTPKGRITRYTQSLRMREGVVRTSLTWTASDGRATDLTYDVLADRDHAHAGAVRLRMTPHWSGEARVTDVLDGRGARRVSQTGGGDRTADGARTAGGAHAADDGGTMDVTFRTDGTKTDGAVASTLRPGPEVRTRSEQRADDAKKLTAKQHVSFTARRGHTYEFTKYVGVDTALTSGSPEKSALTASREAADRGWDRMYAAHAASWRELWRSDVEVNGRPEMQKWLRSTQYGLLASTREGADDSIAPTGLSSDNYAGLVFWDAETWMYPGLLATRPELAKSVVDYRYRTREGARANARRLGHSGLFYGWNTGSHGDLWKECHSWDPPHCRTQNHLQSDIALATWQYYLATRDTTWLRERGWPVLKGIAEFWADRATRNGDGSYSVKNVAGPDEYSNGVDDAVFTNAGAATTLRHTIRAARLLGEPVPGKWAAVADKLRIPYDKEKGVFQQYDGYKGTLIKQADTVLLRYPLEWPMSKATAARTLDYYAERTDPDGPAMTDSVHAIDAADTDEPGCSAYTYLERSVRPFMRGPFSVFSEARGDKAGAEDPLSGSPAQDFLTGKGGFLQVFTNGLTGQRMREDKLRLDPMLPPQLKEGVTLRGLRWQGRTYDVALGAHQTSVRLTEGEPFTVDTPQGDQVVSQGAPLTLKTRRPDLKPTENLARCHKAEASSEQPGMYAGAAVDGSHATAWTPDGKKGALTVDLGRPVDVDGDGGVKTRWSRTAPESHTVEVSADGDHWRPEGEDKGEQPFRYVRVSVTSKDAKKPAGIAEVTVRE
ncbi:glycosyl hydrolase family 95 catalytic domain-containing protein [Streptomyces daliensis]|uniref:Discoidin domain-containing protein n=1 Tax=Streptomyces daliensis TaxID=299421 RepID=A0A8T4ISK8_9ACTN|nr:discoidin domain-containing protein [Streptomyces daliensis]